MVTTQCTSWRFIQRIQRSRINVGQLVHVVLQRVARLEEFSSASKVMFVERKEIPFIASNIFLFLQHPFLLRWCFKTPSSSFVWCKHETRQVFSCVFFFVFGLNCSPSRFNPTSLPSSVQLQKWIQAILKILVSFMMFSGHLMRRLEKGAF